MEEAYNIVASAASTKTVDFNCLVLAAADALSLIEQWNLASCEHPEVVPIITAIQQQGVSFYHALDSSIKCAENGYQFSHDSEYLCQFLLDPTVTAEDLCEYIADMKTIAKRAHSDALSTNNKFRTVRTGLDEISKGIAPKITEIEDRKTEAGKRAGVAESHSDTAETVSGVAGGTALLADGAIVVALAKGVAVSGAMLTVPIALPIASIIGLGTKIYYARQARERETEKKTCEEAIQELFKAVRDLTALIRDVDTVIEWWNDMETMLMTVEKTVREWQGGTKIPKLRIKTVNRTWGDVKSQYLGYKTKVYKLQDYYPSSRITS